MQTFYDYKKFIVLYVDDEETSLKQFTLAFEDHFRILTASNAADGFKLFEQHKDEIGILISDQRMPGEKGVQLLERARQLRPRIVRMLATAYSDMEAAVSAINAGAIYKYVNKPWDPVELEITLKHAMAFFIVQMERDYLLREKLSVLQNMMITDRVVSLGVLAAGLSHHMRNSLVAVRTFLDLAPSKLREENIQMEELRNPNYWREFYTHVQSQVKRIMDMLNELGGVSEAPRPTFPDRIQLHDVINRAVAKTKSQLDAKKITVVNSIADSLPVLNVDLPKFERIFELLLKDEAISLPEGSAIGVKAELSANNEMINVEIRDNGPGLQTNELRSVFNPFFARKDDPQEFGINLMTCYFLVFHHGAKIDIQNDGVAGTVFILSIPVQPLKEVPAGHDDREFIAKVLNNEELWERLLSGENERA